MKKLFALNFKDIFSYASSVLYIALILFNPISWAIICFVISYFLPALSIDLYWGGLNFVWKLVLVLSGPVGWVTLTIWSIIF